MLRLEAEKKSSGKSNVAAVLNKSNTAQDRQTKEESSKILLVEKIYLMKDKTLKQKQSKMKGCWFNIHKQTRPRK